MKKNIVPTNLKKLAAALLTATAAIGLNFGTVNAASLSETVRTALQFNPELDIVKSDRLAVDQELRLARAGYLPRVDTRAAIGPEYSDNPTTRSDTTSGDETLLRREAQLTLTQLLFDGFATQSEVERQRSRVNSASFRVQEASEFVAVDAIEAHLNVLRNEEIVLLNEGNIAQHQRYLNQVRDLEESGRGDIADVRQAEARLARAKETLAISRGDLADSIATYISIVGDRPGTLESAIAPVDQLPDGPEDAARLASTNSPTVLIASADVDVASAELRASRAGFYPNLNLELNGSAAEDINGSEGSNVGASALVVMNYNLFNGGGDIALEREAFHRLNEARASLERARVDAEELARTSFNAYDTAKARTEALTSKAEAQRRVRDAYASQFQIGQRDLLDLLDSENELFLDRVNLTTAQVTEEFAVYRVLGVIGELLDTLDVSRPRENITIERSPENAQTPEQVEEKTVPIHSISAEPRALRGEDAGEPPQDELDIAPFTGAPVPKVKVDEVSAATPVNSPTAVSYAKTLPEANEKPAQELPSATEIVKKTMEPKVTTANVAPAVPPTDKTANLYNYLTDLLQSNPEILGKDPAIVERQPALKADLKPLIAEPAANKPSAVQPEKQTLFSWIKTKTGTDSE